MSGLMQTGPTLYEAEERRKKKGSQGLLGAVGEPLSYAPGMMGLLGNAALSAQYLTGEKPLDEGLSALALMTGLLQGTKAAPIINNAIRVYHGSPSKFEEFDFKKSKDGGVHFGSKEQAAMRALKSGQIVEADIDITRPMTSRDTGGNWKEKIQNAKSKGYDSIKYLNRYEGVNLDTINKAQEMGIDLDKLTDAQFRKFVKEAQDSYIVFDPAQIKIMGLLGK